MNVVISRFNARLVYLPRTLPKDAIGVFMDVNDEIAALENQLESESSQTRHNWEDTVAAVGHKVEHIRSSLNPIHLMRQHPALPRTVAVSLGFLLGKRG